MTDEPAVRIEDGLPVLVALQPFSESETTK